MDIGTTKKPKTKKCPPNITLSGLLKAPPVGLEPTTNGLTVRPDEGETPENSSEMVSLAANMQQTILNDQKLFDLINKWESLPSFVRNAIHVLASNSTPVKGESNEQ